MKIDWDEVNRKFLIICAFGMIIFFAVCISFLMR